MDDDNSYISRGELKQLLQEILRTPPQHYADFDCTAHREEHEFLRLKMRQEKRRIDRWNKIQASVAGAIIISVLGSIISGLVWVGSLVFKSFNQ